MKTLPINNINTQQTQFKAKFPKQDVKEFLREIKNDNYRDAIPKLYTMLDVIKKLSGQKAKIKHHGMWHQISIDGKSINNDKKYFCAIHALQDATIEHKSTLLKASPIKRLTENEFENAYYNNSKKTIQDIENLFEE